MNQLDLFGAFEVIPAAEPTLVLPKISWSYSKMQFFRDCPRKYYFHYYGSKKRTAKDEALKDVLIELSKLSNKYMVQGNLVHQLIGIYFKKARLGEIWDFKRLSGFGRKIIEETIQFNEIIQNGQTAPQVKFPKPIIKELFYNTIANTELRDELIRVVDLCLHNFLQSSSYEHLREGGKKDLAKIEGDTSFKIHDHLSVDGKVDIAFLDNSLLKIADWKTGKKALEDTSLQLLVYALWAGQFKEWSFDQIEIEKAYLQDGSLEKLEFSAINVDRAKARILQDAELLTEMDEYGKNSVKDAFALHIGKNCNTCPYETICHKKS
ncbi:MAG TPA: PD-(D/E)XK nuclease family protein [Chitinophagaceae bacterium]|nr:PD-(D/E)XK nuclease family protein [Chitinophagaceae bacterium]